jgi:hypothetical protein
VLRDNATPPRASYPRAAGVQSRTIGVYLNIEEESYVEEVARKRGVSKNRAFSLIIDEHRNGKRKR